MRKNNHPQKGDRITVDPIKTIEDVKSIARYLLSNPRDHLLFTLGANNGLRVIDLLKLKVKDLKGKKIGDAIPIRESKTGKTNVLVINKTSFKSLQNYMKQLAPDDDAYLFRSRKGNNMPLQSQAVSKLIKKWTQARNLPGNFGTHTLRKTFGYIQRTYFGVGFEVLCKRYNHSSPAVTMRYLGIHDKEVEKILLNDIG